MWTERPLFARNAKFGYSHINRLGQRGQLWSGVDSDPEYPRSLCGREKSVSSGANVKRAALHPPQTFADGLDPLRCLFSDELQGNVQRLRPRPARIGRETLHAFEKARDAGANFRVEIDADEYSHHLLQRPYKSARRIISNACWVANWRIRLRSPGKLRSTTCVPSSPASAM